MAYNIDKTDEITFSGFELGIAPSPHKGIANIQNGNITTEMGEVMCSFAREIQTQANNTASITLTPLGTQNFSSSVTITNGMWIHISASSITGIGVGTHYYVINKPPGTNNFQLATVYGGSPITVTASGTATFTFSINFGKPIDYAIENYSDGSTTQTRYYVLDDAGYVWTLDTALTASNIYWFLTNYSDAYVATGITVLNGWLLIFGSNLIKAKPTVLLGNNWGNLLQTTSAVVSLSTNNPHFAFVGHQGKCYYTDGNFIGSIFPNTSLLSGGVNIQSYASFTTSTVTGTITTLIGGSAPLITGTTLRIPVVFFTGGTLPTAITAGTVYYITYSAATSTFQVFAAASGGSALDIQTGSAGTQYFNTFYPISAGGASTITWSGQRVNLPFFEVAQCLVEVGNTVVIGCRSNYLYPWNQIDVLPANIIPLPESNVRSMVTVNNMAYVFAGNKGNIYVTNGNTASVVITVPDYCAGIAGTKSSYIEPYFIWGGAMFCRGRVFFSIQDQTATKAGNCGGIWSFVPTQNLYTGMQDTGIALRQEHISSYGTYNGMSILLLPATNQQGIGIQFFSAWASSIASPTYGIDFTGTFPRNYPTIIETDIVPTGTTLNKRTFKQIEYKLSTPLLAGETVTIKYRQNSTDAWVSCGTAIVESTGELSGYFTVNFEKGQWLQLQVALTPYADAAESFIRLVKIYVR